MTFQHGLVEHTLCKKHKTRNLVLTLYSLRMRVTGSWKLCACVCVCPVHCKSSLFLWSICLYWFQVALWVNVLVWLNCSPKRLKKVITVFGVFFSSSGSASALTHSSSGNSLKRPDTTESLNSSMSNGTSDAGKWPWRI